MSYEPTINNILRDKAQRWSLNYYNDKTTSYDVPLARAHAMLELMEKESEFKVAQKTHASFLAISKNPNQRLKEDIKAIESKIGQLKADISRLVFISHGAVRTYSLSSAQDIIDTLAYKQLLEQQRTSGIQGARNLFMANGDEAAMRESVEAVETRFRAVMASLDAAPRPVAAPEPEPEPEAPQTKKRNRRYDEEDYDWDELEKVGGWRMTNW